MSWFHMRLESAARWLTNNPVVERGRLVVVGLAVAFSTLGAPAPTMAAAAPWCECVGYVQNYIGHINTFYAKDAGPALQSMGYRASGAPMGINDIVVLQSGFGGAFSSGHIAFLASWKVSGGMTTVTLRGTNQPGGWWTDHNCKNVSLWTFSYWSNAGIRFYRK